MGLYDTIVLEKEYLCPVCGRKVTSVQVKDFDAVMRTFRIGDCISDPDDIRVVKKELYCDTCKDLTGKHVYLTVNRGILLGSSQSLEEAKSLIDTFGVEKLILYIIHSMRNIRSER